MKFFKRKGPYDIDNSGLDRKEKRRTSPKEELTPEQMAKSRRTVFILIGNTILSVLIYFGCSELNFYPIFFVYLGGLIVLGLAYIIYNKGFIYRGATPEMLPDSLPAAEKQALLGRAAERMKKSRWMLLIMIPLLITLLLDVLYLFLLEDLIEQIKPLF